MFMTSSNMADIFQIFVLSPSTEILIEPNVWLRI